MLSPFSDKLLCGWHLLRQRLKHEGLLPRVQPCLGKGARKAMTKHTAWELRDQLVAARRAAAAALSVHEMEQQ